MPLSYTISQRQCGYNCDGVLHYLCSTHSYPWHSTQSRWWWLRMFSFLDLKLPCSSRWHSITCYLVTNNCLSPNTERSCCMIFSTKRLHSSLLLSLDVNGWRKLISLLAISEILQLVRSPYTQSSVSILHMFDHILNAVYTMSCVWINTSINQGCGLACNRANVCPKGLLL